MSELAPAEGSVPQQEVPRQNFVARIAGVLFSPGATFRDIVRRPDWVAPMILIVFISLLSTILTTPRIDFESTYREALAQNPKMAKLSPDQQDRQIRLLTGIGKTTNYFRPLGAVILPLILAAIYLLGVRLAGGEASYVMLLAISLYAQVPMLIRKLLNTVIALTRHNIRLEQADNLLRSNLSFLADLKTNPAAFTALASLDLFSIWALIVTIIGIGFTPRMTRGKAAAVVITVTLVFLLFGVGAVAMSMLAKKATS